MNTTLEPAGVVRPAEPKPVVTPAAPIDPTVSGRLSRPARLGVFGTLLLLPVFTLAVGVAGYARHAVRPPAPASPVAALDTEDGGQLYAFHCASCHGTRGDARGECSPFLDPPARQFGVERFRLATTANGNPTDDDLLYVVKHGVSGTAMPAFGRLSEPQQRAIVAELRRFTHAGLRQKIVRSAAEQGEVDESEIAGLVHRLAAPGSAVPVPEPFPAASEAALARGRTLYAANCASCHGPEGKGNGPQVKELKNENGSPTRPRDLTRGAFKGGGSPEQLYVRLVVGMPGTPMPASQTLKSDELCDLVHFVRSLSAPAATKP